MIPNTCNQCPGLTWCVFKIFLGLVKRCSLRRVSKANSEGMRLARLIPSFTLPSHPTWCRLRKIQLELIWKKTNLQSVEGVGTYVFDFDFGIKAI